MERYKVTVNGKARDVELVDYSVEMVTFAIDGKTYQVGVERDISRIGVHKNPADSRKISSNLGPNVVAPMPGFLVSVHVKVGDTVKSGDKLAVIEAMKMENNIIAHSSGKVSKIHVSAGQEVSNGQVLMEIVL